MDIFDDVSPDEIDAAGVESEIMDKKPKSFIKRRGKLILVLLGIILFGSIVYYYRGLVIAASVNGNYISRLSVVKELEKRYGKQALDFLITQKLFDVEVSKNNIAISKQEIDNEINSISSDLQKQGQTLAAALAAQGMTESDLRNRVTMQKKLEKILADKIAVADDEITNYIKTNKITFPKGTSTADGREQIRKTIFKNKLNQETNTWISALKARANIKYFVNY